eukprot:TRINITY_DN8027_c0_g1_i1.p1 TRINITY_DN8027_c0_g1~~TRINITY_DN8027_c0_g1_i1.p1  ORF type:complete len:361 (+),score=61.95 TRINITY_DN8027_c0_g1_i1:151-1233(+)
MSCDIWLVRHGETVDNVRGLAQGQNDGKLTDSGIKQAQLLAGRLLRENFARICVSDLGRCRETYAPLQEAGWQCEFCPEVREKACGVLEGRPVGTAAKEAVAAGVPVREYRPQGGESWEDVAARARPFLEGVLLAQQCHGTSSSAASSSGGKEVPKIMVLTHGGFIKEVMNVIFPDDPPSLNAAKNTGIYILRAVRDDAASTAVKRARSGGCGITGWTIRLMVKNDASHLDGGGSGSAYSGLLGGSKRVSAATATTAAYTRGARLISRAVGAVVSRGPSKWTRAETSPTKSDPPATTPTRLSPALTKPRSPEEAEREGQGVAEVASSEGAPKAPSSQRPQVACSVIDIGAKLAHEKRQID